MSEMIEKVDDAIRREAEKVFGVVLCNASGALARAAIEAMREPTFAMVEAPASLEIDPGTADEIYRAMIDAALTEASR